MDEGQKDRRRTRPNAEPLPRWDYVSSGELLTPDRERELSTRARGGDTAARDRMISANIPLVISIARQYGNPHLEAEDLIQEGMIGLCTAVERFDPGKGFRFSTYATYWIKQRVLRALDRDGRLIRLPVDVAYAARRVVGVREQLAEDLGREPTLDEMAPACGVSAKRLKAVLECVEEPLPLDAPLGDEADPLTLDAPDPAAPDPEEELLRAERSIELQELLESLSARDRLVLTGRFGLEGAIIPLSDLAERLQVTREGVRQIQRRALLKLRRRFTEREVLAACSH
jgi:RNA polymerase sigma factor (sigma-70 family)